MCGAKYEDVNHAYFSQLVHENKNDKSMVENLIGEGDYQGKHTSTGEIILSLYKKGVYPILTLTCKSNYMRNTIEIQSVGCDDACAVHILLISHILLIRIMNQINTTMVRLVRQQLQ